MTDNIAKTNPEKSVLTLLLVLLTKTNRVKCVLTKMVWDGVKRDGNGVKDLITYKIVILKTVYVRKVMKNCNLNDCNYFVVSVIILSPYILF